MPPAEIVFLDRESLSPETRLRAPDFPHRLTVFDRSSADEVAARIADADIVITNKVPVRADAIAAAPRLRLIAVCATGTDMVDVKAAAARGIVVSNVRNYATDHRPRACLRPDLRAPPEPARLSRLGPCRPLAGCDPVLLLRPSDRRPRRIDPRRRRPRLPGPGRREDRRGLRHGGALRRAKG